MDEIGGDPGASPFSGGLLSILDYGDKLLVKASHKLPFLAKLFLRFPLSARGLLLALVGLLLLLLLPPLVAWGLRRAKRLDANFRGETIVQSYGLVPLLWAGGMLAFTGWLLPLRRPDCGNWWVAVVGFGVLGWIDDTWGDKRIKGLKGHFQAFFHERRVTTGFVKAVGGMVLALWLGFRLFPQAPLSLLLSAALIALSANAINLLDLRPGRAGGVFLLCSVLLLAFAFGSEGGRGGFPLLLLVVLPALVVWERDARAKVMMGDTGSNLLGAALGLATVQMVPVGLQGVALLGLLGLHLVAERVSLTKMIEGNRLLRFLDSLTGAR